MNMNEMMQRVMREAHLQGAKSAKPFIKGAFEGAHFESWIDAVASWAEADTKEPPPEPDLNYPAVSVANLVRLEKEYPDVQGRHEGELQFRKGFLYALLEVEGLISKASKARFDKLINEAHEWRYMHPDEKAWPWSPSIDDKGGRR